MRVNGSKLHVSAAQLKKWPEVLERLTSFNEAELDWLEKLILEHHCQRTVSKIYAGIVLYKINRPKFKHFNTPYYYSSTFYPLPRQTISPSDESMARNFFS